MDAQTKVQPEAEVLTANLSKATAAIVAALEASHLSRDHGENLLAYIIGMSRGARFAEPTTAKIEKSLALGYMAGISKAKG